MRPQRLYKTDKGRYYFIIEGKRKYIAIPKGMTEAELMKLNTNTILKLYGKRLKRRKKRKAPLFEKPIVKGAVGNAVSLPNLTASSSFVEQSKPIIEISDIVSGKLRKRREQYLEDLSTLARSTASTLTPPVSAVGGPAVSVGPLPSTADVGPSASHAPSNASDAPSNLSSTASTPLSSFAPGNLFAGLNIGENANNLNRPLRNDRTADKIDFKKLSVDTFNKPTTDDKVQFGNIEEDYSGYTLPDAKRVSRERQATRAKARGKELEKLKGKYEYDNPPEPEKEKLAPPEGKRPVYTKPSRAQYQDYLKKGASGLMPSSQIKPLSVEEKLATTPSYSGTPQGTDAPAVPLASNRLSSPMPVSIAEQVRKEMGFGAVEEGGLYNDQIAKIIRKRVGHIVPVVPIDKVSSLLDYVAKGDKKFAAVVNTNPSTSDGSGTDGQRPGHWRAIFINNEDDFPSVEYFDPLVEGPPEKSLVDVMRKLCKKINPENKCLYKENKIRRQAKEKSTCGWHAMQFIDDRWNGVPWSEATGYDHFIENQPVVADDSVDGEADVSKYIKKYKVYL